MLAFKRAFLDLLFPRVCVGCGHVPGTEFLHFCWDCVAVISFITGAFCRVCGDPANGVVGEDWVCSHCSNKPPFFDLARSVARHNGILRKAVLEFKYKRGVWLAHDFALMLSALARDALLRGVQVDFVLPVPLHPFKEWKRTYNQSALLAADLSRCLGARFMRGNLIRKRDAGTQTYLTAQRRSANVQGAFQVKRPRLVAGRCLLLVDDVMTTGATANECARVLKDAGAAKVYVATVARG